MKRIHRVIPGYDCRERCEHDPPGEHGVCGDEWYYAVVDGPLAVSISILSTNYPSTVARPLLAPLERNLPTALVGHVAAPGGIECDLLGHCAAVVSYLAAQEFWRRHGDDRQPEQPESFWLALEAEVHGGEMHLGRDLSRLN